MMIIFFMIFFSGPTYGCSFLDQAEPKVGSILSVPPEMVRLRFDHELKNDVCTLTVKNANGDYVDKRDARVDPNDPNVLEIGLTNLTMGNYKVSWTIVSAGGHTSSGDFTFVVRQAKD